MLKIAKMSGNRILEMTSILLAFSISLGRLNGVATSLDSMDSSGSGSSDGGACGCGCWSVVDADTDGGGAVDVENAVLLQELMALKVGAADI